MKTKIKTTQDTMQPIMVHATPRKPFERVRRHCIKNGLRTTHGAVMREAIKLAAAAIVEAGRRKGAKDAPA